MVFSFYGHPVSQSRIVQETYGGIVNMPALGLVMAQALNRSWTDDRNAAFSSHVTGDFDPQAGISTLDNSQLIGQLDRDHPFVIGSNGHAMVVTSMRYLETPFGLSIEAVGVFDPWPFSPGARILSAFEATPVTQGGGLQFAATVDVQEQTSGGGTGSNPFGSAGGATDAWLLGILLVAGLAMSGRSMASLSGSLNGSSTTTSRLGASLGE
jgi:hypothetical protein